MRPVVPLALVFALVACGLAVQGAGEPPAGPASDGGLPPEDSSLGGSSGLLSDARPGDAGPCKGRAGPESIVVGTYCIDRTEVTRAQYMAFIESPARPPQPPECSWNDFFGSTSLLERDELPVMNLDWCDAHAYCTWAGKRLCTSSEARAACGPDGALYPYGPTYEERRCNDARSSAGDRVPVGSLSCASNAGVHDLVGNVWEWIADCRADAGANDMCTTRGGAWSIAAHCDSVASRGRDLTAPTIGFRCCSDLGP